MLAPIPPKVSGEHNLEKSVSLTRPGALSSFLRAGQPDLRQMPRFLDLVMFLSPCRPRSLRHEAHTQWLRLFFKLRVPLPIGRGRISFQQVRQMTEAEDLMESNANLADEATVSEEAVALKQIAAALQELSDYLGHLTTQPLDLSQPEAGRRCGPETPIPRSMEET
jgi:hypothetical protein